MEPNFTETQDLYIIPKKYRVTENLHIVFWLVKDVCWCIAFKPLGIAMIFPTIILAAWIAWQNRQIVAELFHNLAVLFWISANSYWMISEFFRFDEKKVLGELTGKDIAVVPFTLGILCLAWYYLTIFPKERKIKKA